MCYYVVSAGEGVHVDLLATVCAGAIGFIIYLRKIGIPFQSWPASFTEHVPGKGLFSYLTSECRPRK